MIYLVVLFVMAAYMIQHPIFKGYVSESKIRYFLHKLEADDNYIVLHDIILPTKDGKTEQIDHIVLSVYGIFVIESISDKGFFYGDEKKKYWTRVIFNKKVRFLSPIFQNYRNISSIEHLIGCKPFISIVAYNTNAKLRDIQVTKDFLHLAQDRRILKVIEQYQEEVIPQEELVRMENILLKNMISNKGIKKEQVKRRRLESNESALHVSREVCPVCGRQGKKGSSFVCSNQGSCLYAEKI